MLFLTNQTKVCIEYLQKYGVILSMRREPSAPTFCEQYKNIIMLIKQQETLPKCAITFPEGILDEQ